jgi:hypothetical protein
VRNSEEQSTVFLWRIFDADGRQIDVRGRTETGDRLIAVYEHTL